MPQREKPPPCPRCGSTDTIAIAYGYPGPEMMEEMERGEIVLGGCCIGHRQPTDKCKACGMAFQVTTAPRDRA